MKDSQDNLQQILEEEENIIKRIKNLIDDGVVNDPTFKLNTYKVKFDSGVTKDFVVAQTLHKIYYFLSKKNGDYKKLEKYQGESVQLPPKTNKESGVGEDYTINGKGFTFEEIVDGDDFF